MSRSAPTALKLTAVAHLSLPAHRKFEIENGEIPPSAGLKKRH